MPDDIIPGIYTLLVTVNTFQTDEIDGFSSDRISIPIKVLDALDK